MIVEIHAAHACNLNCESCSHFSGDHLGWVSLDTIRTWVTPWASRLSPETFRVLGGEPTLNPELGAILRFIKATWPQTKLELTTNGFFLGRHPDLPAVLSETGATLNWTIHHDSAEFAQKIEPIRTLLDTWQQTHPFRLTICKSSARWTRRYHGAGAEVMPFADGDPASSWRSCAARFCRQLFLGKLWKCSPLAYLQLQKQTYPSLSAAWDLGLAYKPLEPSCTALELEEFLGREDEVVCGMCPANPQRFDKPIPLRRRIQ